MRLTKGAITNLIANYKSVLERMLVNNRARFKRHSAALLAGLLIAGASPAMAADYSIGTGGNYPTLQALLDAPVTLGSGDTITFLGSSDSSLTGTLSFDDNGTLTLKMDSTISNVVILPQSSLGTSFINVEDGRSLTLIAENGKTITIQGFTRAITQNAGETSSVIIGSAGSTGTIIFKDNDSTTLAPSGGGGAVRGNEVTIEGGTNIFDNNTSPSVGGAIYGSDTVTIAGGANTFKNNSATSNSGGAIYGETSVTITNGTNKFIENHTDGGGGAIGSGSGDVIIDNGTNDFNTNTANNGGAIDGFNSVTINNGINTFEGNHAILYGGAIYSETSVAINNGKNTFAKNTADGGGGAIASQGSISITGAGENIFSKNEGLNGGAINGYTEVTINGGTNTFTGNKALSNTGDDGHGGAIYSETGTVEITTGLNTFTGNTATNKGGAISSGVGINITGGTTTFRKNAAQDGGAIFSNGNITFDNNSVMFYDNIASDSKSSALYTEEQFILRNGAILQGNGGFFAGDYSNTSTGIDFDGSTVILDGTINLSSNSSINFTDMVLRGNGKLTGDAINLINNSGDALTANIASGDTAIISSELRGSSSNLTKTGAGTLILSNTATDYTTIDLTNSAGIMEIAAKKYDDDTLALGTVTNDARLNFITDGSSNFYKKEISIGTSYTGTGTIGLQASVADSNPANNWIDKINFDNNLTGNPTVAFTFAPGSNPKNIHASNLVFADLGATSGNADTFSLEQSSSTLGAYRLGITTDDNQNYSLIADFDPAAGKVYSEVAVAGLGQAASMHGRTLFDATGEAARGSGQNKTGVSASFGRNDTRFKTGSHADVKGNNFAVALGFQANEKTAWGVFGQIFEGDYDTETGNAINSHGDMDVHDFGLFVEYRPKGRSETGAGSYYKGIVRFGRTTSDFRANNYGAGGYTDFSMGRNLFGMSLGGGYLKKMENDKALDYYGHLIYTGLGGNTVTDSIGQEVNFGSSNSFRLLTGARLNFNQTKKTGAYMGAALDYEFSGAGKTYIDGLETDKADLKGLTGILEIGLAGKLDDAGTATINLGLQGYMGKKQGIGGMVTFSKVF